MPRKLDSATEDPPPCQESQAGDDPPQDPPGLMEAFIPYFLPRGSNEDEMIRRMGGCPGCGEGRKIQFESTGKRSFIGDPTSSTIRCQRCGTMLEGERMKLRVVNGFNSLEGQIITLDECQELAAAHRDSDRDKENKPLRKNAHENTGRTVTAGGILSWVVGVFALIASVNSFQLNNAAAALFFFPAAIIVLPPVRRSIENNTNVSFSRWAIILIFLGLYTVGALLYTYAMPS